MTIPESRRDSVITGVALSPKMDFVRFEIKILIEEELTWGQAKQMMYGFNVGKY
jgi:hypothetical protein